MQNRQLKVLIIVVIVAIAIIVPALILTSSPEDQAEPAASFNVSLAVRCDVLVDNLHLLNSEKHELVPSDGIIFFSTTVIAYEGDSVFDILQREMRSAGIHLAFNTMTGTNLAFVEAINNLYTFDAGPLSGWEYTVNGQNTGIGASQYFIQADDIIEWAFTLDFSAGWEED